MRGIRPGDLDENGCGPAWLPTWLIPDAVLGVDLQEACDRHDRAYALGACLDARGPWWRRLPFRRRARARLDADLVMIGDMLAACAEKLHEDVDEHKIAPRTRLALRLVAVAVYYLAVRLGGWASWRWRRPLDERLARLTAEQRVRLIRDGHVPGPDGDRRHVGRGE